MLVIMVFIYLLFTNFTKNDFYRALHERARVAAQLYLEADEISEPALEKIKEEFLTSLPNEIIRVYDSTDELSFVKENNRNWSKKIINEVRAKKYISYQENDNQIVGISYDDNQGSFVILAAAKDVYGKERQNKLLEIMATLFIAQLLIQFLAGRWFAKNTLRPIQKVNEQVQKISATDLHLRLEGDKGKDELSILAANFNDLLSRLEHSFDLQKMFIANASHELKTPITNIIGEIEVAVSKERQAEDYEKTLQSVLVEADRLNDIIRNFLLLANAENDIAVQQTELVRFDELLWEIKEIFSRRPNVLLNIQLDELPEDETQLYIQTNKTLLTIAISNIIQNGLKFSDGKPVIGSLHFNENKITVRITDKGIGITAHALQNIFEPFYRSPEANSYQGHGMGLYISKKIIELLGGTISVQSEPNVGSEFNICFVQNTRF
jgi:signal transduction histidine kinase